MFAIFDNIGGVELVIVLVVALLIFGKRLPEVASQAATSIGKLKRGLEETWRESGVEKEIREIQNVIPRDIDVAGVARSAARKMEERFQELGEETRKSLDVGTSLRDAKTGGAADPSLDASAAAPEVAARDAARDAQPPDAGSADDTQPEHGPRRGARSPSRSHDRPDEAPPVVGGDAV